MAKPKLTLVDEDTKNASAKAAKRTAKKAPKPAPRTIEKNIPIPKRKGGVSPLMIYPELYELKKGESVLIEGVKRTTLTGTLAHLRKSRGGLIVSRRVEGGIRVWRVK